MDIRLGHKQQYLRVETYFLNRKKIIILKYDDENVKNRLVVLPFFIIIDFRSISAATKPTQKMTRKYRNILELQIRKLVKISENNETTRFKRHF